MAPEMSNLKPPRVRYTKPWDINKLFYIHSFGTNDDLALKEMALKASWLLTIVAGKRRLTLRKLEISHMDETEDKVIFI